MTTLTEMADEAASMHRHGCHNRAPFRSGYWVGGYVLREMAVGRPVLVEVKEWIEDRSSRECQHDSAADPACRGCRWLKLPE